MVKNTKIFKFMQNLKYDNLEQFIYCKSYQHLNTPKSTLFNKTCPQNCGNVDNLPILSPIL